MVMLAFLCFRGYDMRYYGDVSYGSSKANKQAANRGA